MLFSENKLQVRKDALITFANLSQPFYCDPRGVETLNFAILSRSLPHTRKFCAKVRVVSSPATVGPSRRRLTRTRGDSCCCWAKVQAGVDETAR